MPGNLSAVLLLATLGLLLVSAGIEDARNRNIANWKNAAIALLAPMWWLANGLDPWPGMVLQLALGLSVLAVFALAFAIGQMGGGDVKLIAALALWMPVDALIWVIVLMSLLGGALTMLMVVEQWIANRGGLRRLPVARLLGAVSLLTVAGIGARAGFATPAVAADPILRGLLLLLLVALVGLLLVRAVRWARGRGLVPETPYGVAIAIAALLVIHEPIFNHFG